jgi:hypothetical protein
MTIRIFDPTIETSGRHIAYAPRPKSLAGLRIGLVDNTKFNSDELLQRIGVLLERDYGASTHTMRRKRGASVPAHQEIIDEFRENCDVMVAGIGD